MSESLLSYSELLIHRGPHSLSFSIWIVCPSYWSTSFAFPSTLCLDASSSLENHFPFFLCCSRCLKYLPSHSPRYSYECTHIKRGLFWEPFLTLLGTLREYYSYLCCNITPVMPISWLLSVSHTRLSSLTAETILFNFVMPKASSVWHMVGEWELNKQLIILLNGYPFMKWNEKLGIELF